MSLGFTSIAADIPLMPFDISMRHQAMMRDERIDDDTNSTSVVMPGQTNRNLANVKPESQFLARQQPFTPSPSKFAPSKTAQSGFVKSPKMIKSFNLSSGKNRPSVNVSSLASRPNALSIA